MLTVQRWLWSSFGQHLWVHLSSRLSPLCFVWYAETCLILKPGSGHITLLKPYTSFILAAERSINVSTHLSGPSTMWTQAAFPVLLPPTSFSRSLQLWQNQSLFPEPASTWAARGLDSHTKTLPSCPSKADLPSGPISNVAYMKLLLMPLISVITSPTEPPPAHSAIPASADQASHLSSTL